MILACRLAMLHGQKMQKLGIVDDAGCVLRHKDIYFCYGDFSDALYDQTQIYGMAIWAEWTFTLMALKLHERREHPSLELSIIAYRAKAPLR